MIQTSITILEYKGSSINKTKEVCAELDIYQGSNSVNIWVAFVTENYSVRLWKNI